MPHQDSRRRAEQALRLRSCGRTWTEIADALGYRSRAGARQAVERLVASTAPETTTEGRRTSVEALRVLRSVLFDRFAEAAQRGDDQTLALMSKEIRSNIAEQAKLDGLYAPLRSEVEVAVKSSPTSIVDQAERQLLQTIEGEVVE